MMGVSGATQIIAFLGSPVVQAMSPVLHNWSFRELGIDCVVVAADVVPDQLADTVQGARAMGFAGLVVTMPNKAAILEYLDDLSPSARLMGAVNTVVREGGQLIGHNTDGAGFMRAVAEAGVDVIGKRMTLIGAGGAGSAIYTQAALDGVSEIDVFNLKDPFFDATTARLTEVAEHTGAQLRLHDLADTGTLADAISNSALVADATRVGMAPLDDQSNVDKAWLRPGQAVVDTVYVPRETKLLRIAKEADAVPISGVGMLLWQAAIAERLWFGQEMSVPDAQERFFGTD